MYFRVFDYSICHVFFSSIRQRVEELDRVENKEKMFKNRAILSFPKKWHTLRAGLLVLAAKREERKI